MKTTLLRLSHIRISLLIMLIQVSTIALSFAQQGFSITGQIRDADNRPIENATIRIKKTAITAMSNAQGRYTLYVTRAGRYTLEATSIGFENQSQEVVVKETGTAPVNWTLKTENRVLEHVDVVGLDDGQKRKKEGFHVGAISTRAFANQNMDINQILNTSTGVRIREEGGLGSNYKFSLNGFSGNQVRFFMDGLPMDNFGSSMGLNNIPVNMVDRIEVFKGVVPTYLGSDALGGAVNIITKRNKNYADISYSLGSFHTHRVSLNAGYTHEKSGFTVRTNAFYNTSDNDYKVLARIKNLQTNQNEGEQWVKRFHDDYTSQMIQLEAGVTDKRYADQLLVSFSASGNDKDLQTGTIMDELYGNMTTSSMTFIPSLKYQKRGLFTDNLDATAHIAYNMSDQTLRDTASYLYNWLGAFIPNPAFEAGTPGAERNRTLNKNKNRELLVTTNWDYTLADRHHVSLNYTLTDFNRSAFDPENPDAPGNRFPSNLTKHIWGLSYNTKLVDAMDITVFGKWYQMKAVGYQKVDAFTDNERYDAVTFNYGDPGYGMAASYFVMRDLQLKASYEHAYRLPVSNEIFGDGIFTSYAVGLKPEKSDNINAGAWYRLPWGEKHTLTFEGNAIYRFTFDYIRLNQSTTGGNRTYKNEGKVETWGGEGEIKYTYANLIFAGINATYQRLVDQEEFVESGGFTGGKTANVTYGYRLPNVPYFFGNADLGFHYPLKKAGQSLTFQYRLNYVDPYSIVYTEMGTQESNSQYIIPKQLGHNVFVSYSWNSGRYNVGVECRNLSDELLYDSYRLQKPGRSFAVKLRYFITK